MKIHNLKNLEKIIIQAFILGLFLIPFNSYKGLSFMGEFSQDANALVLIFGVLLLFLNFIWTRKIKFPVSNLTYHAFFIFLIWIVISFLINLPSISDNFFKQTSGINRFIRQLFSLLLSSVLFFTLFYNAISYVGKDKILNLVRKTLLFSLIVVFSYSVLEVVILRLGLHQLKPIIYLFDYLPFVNVNLDYNSHRLSSITYEPPALAMYLITIAGWMFSYILTHKGLKKFIPAILVLFLAVASGSRTSLVVILFQFVLFLIQIFHLKRYHYLIMNGLRIILASVVILLVVNYRAVHEFASEKAASLDFTNVNRNYSNQSRLGIQYTSLLIYKENPVFGVGYGQQAYHAKHKYPYWAVKNNWEFDYKYLNEKLKSFPPGYNIYTRILAETGTIGLILFLCFISSFFYQANELRKKPENRTMGVIILVSLGGFVLNWMQIDSFRMYGVWLCLALLCFFYKFQRKKEIDAI
ncbi:O-antigen ligase family protein [Aquimarina litoralis]|uniref:O-antigen ligase family protein n=1 Tax=Aquimarina litoralis TaxID=584605 RepID=UPI001C570622|nr:O-antigen ligase family protein [Aquimarina litoralis]MBW1293911.1 hypothetical protein [Aquimarina litoralis]